MKEIEETNITGALLARAAEMPDAPALLSPAERTEPLTYGQLADAILSIREALAARGLGNGSRVALVVPGGPEAAMLFLAVAGSMACAPLYHRYVYEEYKTYFARLRVDAAVIDDELEAAFLAARDLGLDAIPASGLRKPPEASQRSGREADGLAQGLAQSHEIALLLHTSGTTGEPKIVPLTHASITASVRNVAGSLGLTKYDRCLNYVPFFHVNGLIIALLSSLSAGGSIVCCSEFSPERFFDRLEQDAPTWFTGVPTMHQAIAAHGRTIGFDALRSPLRFIRSGSAPLPAKTKTELEILFGAPVLEGYGMTETAGQLTINPHPPKARKEGSAGVAVGCEIAIVDDAGRPVAPMETGDVLVRGPTAMAGYENDRTDTDISPDGWLRTGDQGYLDNDGYLFLRGRKKESINRGGEKIWPGEVEAALLRHPAVAEAAAFAVPHETLGEDVGALIVRRYGHDASDKDIRRFASTELADYKLPSRIVFVERIPKGPTGKIARNRLAELWKAGNAVLTAAEEGALEPATEWDRLVAEAWSKTFGDPEGVHAGEDFFDRGGNSIHAAGIIARLEQSTGVRLTFEQFFDHSTVPAQARLIRDRLAPRLLGVSAGYR